MSEPVRPDETVDLSSVADPLDAGLAAAFGPDSGPPLPANGSVLKALGAPPILLREPHNEVGDPILLPQSDAVPAEAQSRYRIDGEIARGGMGAVLKGRDTDLGRDVAVKVLLETHQGKTELVQRFVEEAQIAGQLQHPGITPVYELGQFADKRPYFTMKLVKGQTLAARLTARQDLAEKRTELVGIFAQVCHTLAYAHARGVIHRDLKPANVMVGAFNEVQVMDWGLAKVLREGGSADEQKAQTQQAVSVIRTQRADVGSDTHTGSVMGTPGYVAPEQARGEVDLVDTRADVFGLGAILCEVLTGQPPFTGKNPEALRKAQTAQLDDAFQRLDGCGADRELIALAKQCLAAEPWHRPRDAGVVAETVTAYQNSVAERLRQAELAHAAEAARTREAQATAEQERKARAAAQALALAERRGRRLTMALLLALLAAGAVSGLWLQRQRNEERAEAARQRQAVQTALAKATELRQQARSAEARAVLETLAILVNPKDPRSHFNLGRALYDNKQLDEAIKEYRLVIQLEPKLAAVHNDLGVVLKGKNELDEAIKEFRIAIQLDPKFALPHNNLGNALRAKNELDEAIKEYRIAIQLDPKNAQFHGALGEALLQSGRFTEARESTRHCLELQPNDPLRRIALGKLQQCEQSLALDQKLAAIVEGKETPASDTERLALAQFCQQPFKKLYAASCRFGSEAFANDAKLADAMEKQHRYSAACAAALAGNGQGNDADKLDDKERARLRKQALTWLQADLSHWSKQVESPKPADREQVRKTLLHWQGDADLAGLRDREALQKLPAEEREACQKLWADVDTVLNKANAEK